MPPRDFSLKQADGAGRTLNDPLERLRVVVGDITRPEASWGVDTLVNAANESLLGGGGVDGAIHRAAGPELLAFNRTLGGCPTGLAKSSPAFGLEAMGVSHLIHTVGPVWRAGGDAGGAEGGGEGFAMPGAPTGESAALGYLLEDTLLASCYHHCLEMARGLGSRGVAFPGISTGVYGFPKARAAKIALGHVFGFFTQRPAPQLPERVVFCCFSEGDALVYQEAIESRGRWMTKRRGPA